MRLHLAAFVAFAVLTAAPVRARADKARSLELYKAAKKHYRAGDHRAALDKFQAAYAEHPASEYLFNIAQAHRKLGTCPEALEHYRKFADTKPGAKTRAVVDKHVKALGKKCGDTVVEPKDKPEPEPEPEPPKNHPPAENRPTEPAAIRTPEPASTPTQTASAQVSAPARPAPVRLFAGAGPALYDMGEVEVPLVVGVRVGAGYRLPIAAADVIAGVSAELSPMNYDAVMSGTALLITAVANASVSVELQSNVRVRGELGVGDLAMSGLSQGNPFTAAGADVGTLHMLSARVGAGIDYAAHPQLRIRVSPALVYSLGHSDLADDIDAIIRLSVLVGVAYAL